MKKLISLFIAMLMVLPLTPVSAYSPQFEYEAQMLYDLELFKGTGNGFELDGLCDRLQGATMFVRLLGEEKEATSNPKSHPFIDVKDSWASPYVGQMYNQGYTKGSSATEYGTGKMTANQFATFCLRALDYQDGVDFSVDTALRKMVDLYIINEETYNLIAHDPKFYRDYAVKLAYNTLAAEYKTRRTLPLIEQTIKDFYAGAITEDKLLEIFKPHGTIDDLWKIYYGGGYDLSKQYYLDAFLEDANEAREILLMDLYRKGVVSKENLLKNIFWIEDSMYLYTLPELYDKYHESTVNQYKPVVIEKAELGLGDINSGRKSAHYYKAWELYADSARNITTNNPFDPSYPTATTLSPYTVHEIVYGPMRKCEYYLKGLYQVELSDREQKIADFVQKEFLDKVTDDMDAYDKVMLANKFLCDNVVYDRSAPDTADKSFLYLFEEGKSVCCGYAQVFQFLMKLVDVESYVVSTELSKTPELAENHAWNIVRLDDGKLYHVDTSVSHNNPFISLTELILKYADYEPLYIIEPVFGDPKDIER